MKAALVRAVVALAIFIGLAVVPRLLLGEKQGRVVGTTAILLAVFAFIYSRKTSTAAKARILFGALLFFAGTLALVVIMALAGSQLDNFGLLAVFSLAFVFWAVGSIVAVIGMRGD